MFAVVDLFWLAAGGAFVWFYKNQILSLWGKTEKVAQEAKTTIDTIQKDLPKQ